METILVPTDGSENANKALAVACDLAKQRHGRLLLLHVLLRDKEPEELERLNGLEGASEDLRAALASLRHEAPVREEHSPEAAAYPGLALRPSPTSVLEAVGELILAAALREAANQKVQAEALPIQNGPADECILRCAEREAVSSIVMGRRGLRNIEAIALGSVTQSVSQRTPCTCITVM